MPLITSYVQPQEVAQATDWNPDCPALSKCVSAFFFSDGNRSYINPDFLSPNYTAAPGGASMQRQTNRLGFFVQKTVGGASPMFSGLASPSGCSTITLCQLQYQNIGIMSDSAVSSSWACNSSQKLIVYMASFTRGTSSTSIVGRPVVIGTDNTNNAHCGYIDGTLEIGPVSGYSSFSIDKLGSGQGGTGPDVGFQVFLGFSSVLTAAEHKQIADILLLDPMELFAPVERNILIPSSGPAALAGAASDVASATGALSSSIRLAGGPAAVAGATGSLTSGIPLAGQAAAVSVANGVLTTSVRLSGDALAQVVSSGVLTSGIPLAGNLISVALSNGVLTTQIPLSGAAVAQAAAAASLTTGTGYTLQDIADAVWAKVLP